MGTKKRQNQRRRRTSRRAEITPTGDSLLQQAGFIETLINSLPGSFFIADARGKLLLWNDRLQRESGYEGDELEVKTAGELVASDDRIELQNAIGRVVANKGKQVESVELRLLRKDGSVVPHYVTSLPVVIGGEVCLVGMGIDISAQKEVELELKRREEYFRSVLENSTDVILVIDEGGRFRYVSTSMERVLGYEPAELIGRDSFEIIHPDDRDRLIGTFRQQAAEPGSQEFQSYRIRDKKGEWHEMEGTGTNQLADPVVKGFVINTRDVTEKKKLQQQLLRAQRLEGIGSLSSGIAHDLNNILGPILLAVDIIGKKLSDPVSLRLLETVRNSANRGSGMVRQILMFGRGVEGGKAAIQPKHLIREMVDVAEQTFPRSIRLERDIAGDLHLIEADATQIHQVLLNLFVNARDAMPRGGTLTVSAVNVRIEEGDARIRNGGVAGEYVCMVVADTGTGISGDILKKIFDPFFTTKEEGKGTGLGLSTVATIIREHGGFIDVESVPGRGTKFLVYVPAYEAVHVERKVEVEELPVGEGELVMVVDDESASRDLMAMILKTYGYQTLTAVDGTEALALFAQQGEEIRAILMDVDMPFLDGIAAMRALSKMRKDVKVIIVSGSHEDDRIGAVRDEVSGVLLKPFTTGDLLRIVRSVVE